MAGALCLLPKQVAKAKSIQSKAGLTDPWDPLKPYIKSLSSEVLLIYLSPLMWVCVCEYVTGTYTPSHDDATQLSTCIILEKISDFEEIFFFMFSFGFVLLYNRTRNRK